MTAVYLGLGTNLGDKQANLKAAVEKINERIGEVTSLSSFYETAPWGFESQNSFLNAALCVQTSMEALQILQVTQEIEKELGRMKKSSGGCYTDRLIDIDILLYGDVVLNTSQLVIPHPLMEKRAFVMQPLAEIAPNVVHPLLNKTMQELALQL